MKVKEKIYLKRKLIGKTVIIVLLILFNIFSFISCNTKNNEKDTYDYIILKSNQKEDDHNMLYEDYGTFDYWCKFLEDEKNLSDLYFVIEWLKNNTYCTSLEVEGNGVFILPKEKEKKIQSKEGFDRVKEFLLRTQFLILNNWRSSDRIIFLHLMEDLNGYFSLEYIEGLKDNIGDVVSQKDGGIYKKVGENFYSEFSKFEGVSIYDKLSEEQVKYLAEECKKDSYDYWNAFLQNEENLDELYFIIEWLKKKDYLKNLSFYGDDIFTLPNNKKTVKKIQSEEDFGRVKEFLLRTELKVHNDWLSKKNITFLFEFHLKYISGNYCVVYTEDKIRNRRGKEILDEEERFYKKVIENFYNYVIFYE